MLFVVETMMTGIPWVFGSAFRMLEDGPPFGLLRIEGRWNGRLWDIP